MDAAADASRLWPREATLTSLKLFFITVIEIPGLKRMLAISNETKLCICYSTDGKYDQINL